MEVQIDSIIEDIEKAQRARQKIENADTGRTIDSSKNTSNNSIQLERMKVQKYDGDIRKYPKFKEEFMLYVKPLCQASQLSFVLKSHLLEEVKEDLDNVNDEFDTLWERLDAKYGNKSKLIDTILADIGKIQYGDGKNTLQLIKTVERAHRDLLRMGEEREMQNGTIISMIERKMPDEMRYEWIKLVSGSNDNSEEKFKKLMKMLTEWRSMIEYDKAVIRKVTEKKATIAHHVRESKAKDNNKEGCWIHKEGGEHPIWRCRVFQNKPVTERIALAIENKACRACLKVNCPGSTESKKCSMGFICKAEGCNEAHNSLLHL